MKVTFTFDELEEREATLLLKAKNMAHFINAFFDNIRKDLKHNETIGDKEREILEKKRQDFLAILDDCELSLSELEI